MTYSEKMRGLRKNSPKRVVEFEKSFQKAFYDALDKESESPEDDALAALEDSNNLMDAVEMQRANFNVVTPAFDDSSISGNQQSFAPYEDPNQMSVLASENMLIYKWALPEDIEMSEKMWGKDINQAKNILNVKNKNLALYSAELDLQSNHEVVNGVSNTKDIHRLMLDGNDFIDFSNGVFIIDPEVLTNIKKVDMGDSNNIPLIGLKDNSQGLSNHFHPGQSSAMGGAGFSEGGHDYQL